MIKEMLRDSKKREALIQLLTNSNHQQDGLFESQEERLLNILRGIYHYINEGLPLYQRWTQDVNGKERQLSVPKEPLRRLIDEYLLNLIKKERVHKNCHGGESNWSPKKSLEEHLPVSAVLSFDLKSAWENSPFEKVYGLFYRLIPESTPYREDLAMFLSVLCTVDYKDKRGLPTGSPSGVAIFNRILYPTYELLAQKSKEKGFHCSRWVDDFTVSSPRNVTPEDLLGAIELVGAEFPVSPQKIFFQYGGTKYLLGHKIIDGKRVVKNTKEERLREKISPLNYDQWFGKNKIYTPWH